MVHAGVDAVGHVPFAARTGADELIITGSIYDHAARIRSFEIIAETRTALAA